MNQSQLDTNLIAELLPDIKIEIGTIAIGYIVATALYGISILQTYFYYRNYRDDTVGYKIFVALLWVLDTFTTVIFGQTLYRYTVLNLDNISADIRDTWTFVLEYVIANLITMMAQSFYALQIFRISGSLLLASTIVLMSISALGPDIWVTVQLLENTLVTALTKPKINVTGSVVQGIYALCDIVITVTLILTLRSKKTGIHATENLIDKLISYTITRGVSTAVFQLTVVILNAIYKEKTFWIPFHLCLSKLYVNSVLSVLNVRTSVNKVGSVIQSDWGSDFMVFNNSQTCGVRTLTESGEQEGYSNV